MHFQAFLDLLIGKYDRSRRLFFVVRCVRKVRLCWDAEGGVFPYYIFWNAYLRRRKRLKAFAHRIKRDVTDPLLYWELLRSQIGMLELQLIGWAGSEAGEWVTTRIHVVIVLVIVVSIITYQKSALSEFILNMTFTHGEVVEYRILPVDSNGVASKAMYLLL